MRLEGVFSSQYQYVSAAFGKLSPRDRVIYSVATAVIALAGAYFLKSLFTVMTFIGRMGLHLLSSSTLPVPSDYLSQLRETKAYIEPLEIDEGTKLLGLIQEIEENTKQLHENCQADQKLMKLIYESAVEELQTLVKIARALSKGEPQEETHAAFVLRINSQELRELVRRRKPDLDRVRELLAIVPVNTRMDGDALRGTPLHSVAKRGRAIDAVPVLAKAGADFNITDDWGNTPLLWAIANGMFSMAKCLIENAPLGTNFNILSHGNSALHLALAKGYTMRTRDGAPLTVSSHDLMGLLIPHTNVNLPGDGQNTPLHIACIRRDPVMIRELLVAGADRSLRNSQGETPLDMLQKSDSEAHTFLRGTACVYLLEKRASIHECMSLFT